MKVFISSLITGMEVERAAAKIAVETLRHQPVMAEDFGARPTLSEFVRHRACQRATKPEVE